MEVIFYAFSFGVILSLLYSHKKIIGGKEFNNNKRIIWGYILLFLLSALRFDIGNDYSAYWKTAEILGDVYSQTNNIVDVYDRMDGRFEYGFCLLAILFYWSNNIFFWVSLFFSALSVWVFYFVFSKYQSHFWSIFLIIITEYLFLQWDGVRQSGALALVLMALVYANEKKIYPFVSLVLLASLFHKSAIFMLLVYPLVYLKITNKLLISSIIVCLAVYWTGILDTFINQCVQYFSLIDGYDKYDIDNIAIVGTHTTVFYRMRITLFALIGSFIISLLDEKHSFYKNILTIGLLIFILGGGSLIFTRIAWYFMVVMFPCFGICMNIKNKGIFFKQMLLGVVMAQCIVFVYDVATNTNTRGCVPYESVFSDDFRNQRFRIRDYK